MRALSVVTPSLFDKIEEDKKHLIQIDALQIPLALIEGVQPEFDSDADQYANLVLVKKSSFSLNYRDLGIIENAWRRLQEVEGDSFYPIGSDFAGVVEAVGKNVKNLSEGDLVIGNGFYPDFENGAMPGIPSNHASKEYEVYHFGKLVKVPEFISKTEAGTLSIGVQTANSMIRRAGIKEGENVLVTSVTSNTSFFILNALWEKGCNVYGLSFSGKNTEKIKEHFPFIKEIYSIKENNIPKDILFDVVFDAFSDTYLEYLVDKMNMSSRYLTCGIFNQSSEKMREVKPANLSLLIAKLMMRNISLIGNCLGTTDDLVNGLQNYETNKMFIDSVFTDNDKISDFISKTYNLSNDKFGKVVFQY
ncbi:zinc-binding alcohol dehydrogenase family protein [Flavobacterium amniphilum]|uniref:MDR/zinc-dependent alcohol dehydrogenase-like family protein n=1 Tax=Flavobacterium amniphilum TaxID=1834035 RepID=UPI002029D774|nr:zinc-binding alcohol dehydrogenase family protein [Flavobacterium amniphilum]MCL9807132.1 zinc-binding alcohol dehydrogenase family protein [Flavobacterium amniphilum]